MQAQMTKTDTKRFMQILQAAPTFSDVIDSLKKKDYRLDSASIPMVREALWQRLLDETRRIPTTKEAFEAGKITYAEGKVGRFSIEGKRNGACKWLSRLYRLAWWGRRPFRNER